MNEFALFTELALSREEHILKTLVVAHNNGALTSQQALSGIATIAALRGLLSDLQARLKRKD